MSPFAWKYLVLTIALLGLGACTNGAGDDDDNSNGNGGGFETLSAELCDPAAGGFTTQIDNAFFPLPPGRTLEFEGMEGAVQVGLTFAVTQETENVAGVTTRVVNETHTEDGEIVETSRNFFVQASDGTVCYYGEEVDNFVNGVLDNHNGSWRAGEAGNQPGIFMPGSPRLNTQFNQEDAPGIAEDMSAIVGLGESLTVPLGTFENVLNTIDWNPLNGETSADGEDKFYAPNVGLIRDNTVELVSMVE